MACVCVYYSWGDNKQGVSKYRWEKFKSFKEGNIEFNGHKFLINGLKRTYGEGVGLDFQFISQKM